MTQDRRGFILTSAKVFSGTALSSLPLMTLACDPVPVEEELPPAEGTFARPFTREDPGEWTEKIEIHQPVLFGSLAQNGARLWVEVLDINTSTVHAMTAEHYIERIIIEDNYGNIIADVVFPYNAQARVVTTVAIPLNISSIKVYEKCNLHGWWKSSYSIDAATELPKGDFRRPLDAAYPGDFEDKIYGHIPYLGRNAIGDLVVEVGNRERGALHPMGADHSITDVALLDHYGQVRALRRLDYNQDIEPVVNLGRPTPSPSWRVIARCNLHSWWEASYSPDAIADMSDSPADENPVDAGQ
ncbi:MAG: hypothetical protein GY822_30090 [Deltaproteobacteria bacterium]|nr:hypothetical protein [Deltaproteobacteria bacterium]